jgi:heme-degrading monooxygenase HmoA
MSNDRFAPLAHGECYAVIFSNQRTAGDNGYAEMAEKMAALAAQQPGYLGMESARGADGFGITVSYWESEAAIRNWKAHTEHLVAQSNGAKIWYEHYITRVAKLSRAYAKSTKGNNRV